jgi:hypothetical protein
MEEKRQEGTTVCPEAYLAIELVIFELAGVNLEERTR